jgi:hypothetical protein
MTTKKKVLSGVVRTEVLERNRRIKKLSRQVRRAARALLESRGWKKTGTSSGAWKRWKRSARELTAEVSLQDSTLRLVRRETKRQKNVLAPPAKADLPTAGSRI